MAASNSSGSAGTGGQRWNIVPQTPVCHHVRHVTRCPPPGLLGAVCPSRKRPAVVRRRLVSHGPHVQRARHRRVLAVRGPRLAVVARLKAAVVEQRHGSSIAIHAACLARCARQLCSIYTRALSHPHVWIRPATAGCLERARRRHQPLPPGRTRPEQQARWKSLTRSETSDHLSRSPWHGVHAATRPSRWGSHRWRGLDEQARALGSAGEMLADANRAKPMSTGNRKIHYHTPHGAGPEGAAPTKGDAKALTAALMQLALIYAVVTHCTATRGTASTCTGSMIRAGHRAGRSGRTPSWL